MENLSLTKVAGSLSMAFIMSSVPNVVLADKLSSSSVEMIPSSVVLNEISRAEGRLEAEAEVRSFLQKSEVQSELAKQGLSAHEISARLASLSEQELQQLHGQVKEARAGGDLLVTVFLVVLIIYFIQRI